MSCFVNARAAVEVATGAERQRDRATGKDTTGFKEGSGKGKAAAS